MASAVVQDIISGLRANGDRPEGPEKNLLSWLDAIDRESLQWRDAADLEHWNRWIRLYSGQRYGAAARQPKFTANTIRPTIDRKNALLTENKPSAKILPWRDGLQAAATILEKLFEADWHVTDMQLNLEEMVQLGSVLGSAGIDASWNPSAHFGEGAFDPVVLDPRQVGFDPIVRKARKLDKAQYVWIETVRNVWELQREYPGRGMLIRPDASVSSINTLTNNRASIITQLNTSFASRMQRLEQGPIPRKICREYWLRDPSIKGNGELKFPRGRKIERGGQLILDDGPNPYWDGDHPVVWYDGKSDIDSAWGQSEVEALRYIANAINRIGDLFVENSILGGNLVVITDADAMKSDTINRLTNAAALIIPKKFGRQLEFRPPPAMPPHMLQFISFALGMIDYLVGLKDGMSEGLKGRMEVRSGLQLEGLQTASQVLVKSAARRLESFLERFGQKYISRVFQYMTGDRVMYFLDNKQDYQQWTFNYRQFQEEFQQFLKQQNRMTTKGESLADFMQTAWRHFAFRMQPFSSLASNKIARTQMLAQLAQTGRFPFKMVLQEIGYQNAEELMQTAQQELAKYGPPTPPKSDKKK